MSTQFTIKRATHPVIGFSGSAPRQAAHVISFGGGTGLSMLLRGWKRHTYSHANVAPAVASITAVVAVTDDGGSSGRLRRELRMLPPGDIRNCLVALAEDEALLSRMFDYRFMAGEGLQGHSFGNLFLAVLASLTDDFAEAVRLSSLMLATRGRVLPVTAEHTLQLCAELNDGRTICGETNISASSGGIRRVWLNADCEPLAEVIEAIAVADLITIGPGSLYTSVLPHLLVKGIAEALQAAPAVKMYICNVMTQSNETLEMDAQDHLRVLQEHTGLSLFDYIVVNNAELSPEVLARYAEQGSEPVAFNRELLEASTAVIEGDFLSEGSVARHAPEKISNALLAAFNSHRSFRPVRI